MEGTRSVASLNFSYLPAFVRPSTLTLQPLLFAIAEYRIPSDEAQARADAITETSRRRAGKRQGIENSLIVPGDGESTIGTHVSNRGESAANDFTDAETVIAPRFGKAVAMASEQGSLSD